MHYDLGQYQQFKNQYYLKCTTGIASIALSECNNRNKMHLNVNETLYVTAEDFYFADNKLVDLADTFVKQGGQHLFIE